MTPNSIQAQTAAARSAALLAAFGLIALPLWPLAVALGLLGGAALCALRHAGLRRMALLLAGLVLLRALQALRQRRSAAEL